MTDGFEVGFGVGSGDPKNPGPLVGLRVGTGVQCTTECNNDVTINTISKGAIFQLENL